MATQYKVKKYPTGPTAYTDAPGCKNCGQSGNKAGTVQPLIPPPSNRVRLESLTDAQDAQGVQYGFFGGDVNRMKVYAEAEGYAKKAELSGMDSTEVARLIYRNIQPLQEQPVKKQVQGPKIGEYNMEFVRDGDVKEIARLIKKADLKKALTGLGIKNDNPKAEPEEMVLVLQAELKRRHPATS